MLIMIPNNIVKDNYGYILHLLRLINNLSITDISKYLNVSKKYAFMLEKCHSLPVNYLEKLCFIYDISLSKLKQIHNISKTHYNWDYQKTMKDIMGYYLDKKQFEENY